MRTSFTRLGLDGNDLFAVVLVYLVMAINFSKSWLDPFYHPDGAAWCNGGYAMDAAT